MSRPYVILVNPKMCRPHSVRLPLSILSLGAVLGERYDYGFVDGNVDPRALERVLELIQRHRRAVVAMTVMPGPQIVPAIAMAAQVRDRFPHVPIVWGGYFPTLYPDSAINAPYVDYVVRGQGERSLIELLERLPDSGSPRLRGGAAMDSATDSLAVTDVAGLTWKRNGEVVHNVDRPFAAPNHFPPLPYDRLDDVNQYFRPSFLGRRTAVHQAALGCRYHCTFCGVVSMFNGYTSPEGPQRLDETITMLVRKHSADAIQFYDHNFFDREASSMEALEVLAQHRLPWWCYARADTLAKFSSDVWNLIRRSRLTMTYVGAEAASDNVLRKMKKGSKIEHTLLCAERCREYGVIPEFSFVLGGPEDPEQEVEKTFAFIKQLKKVNPHCEIVLYLYSPTPQRDRRAVRQDEATSRVPVLSAYGPSGPPLPSTPEEWTQKRWQDYVCHQDAPWLTPRIKQRIKDFGTVLGCRFPTAQDYRTPRWGKALLKTLARWRYATGYYTTPRELHLAKRFLPLREPQRDSI